MNTKGVNFQPSKRGQFSAAVDTESQMRSATDTLILEYQIKGVFDGPATVRISNACG